MQRMKNKVVEISRECDCLSVDIAVLTETKKKETCSEIIDKYVMCTLLSIISEPVPFFFTSVVSLRSKELKEEFYY